MKTSVDLILIYTHPKVATDRVIITIFFFFKGKNAQIF